MKATLFALFTAILMVGCATRPTPNLSDAKLEAEVKALKREANLALRDEFLERLGTYTTAEEWKWRKYFEEFAPIKTEWEADKWVRKYHQDISSYYSEKFANFWRMKVIEEGWGTEGEAAIPMVKNILHDTLVKFVIGYADYYRKGSVK